MASEAGANLDQAFGCSRTVPDGPDAFISQVGSDGQCPSANTYNACNLKRELVQSIDGLQPAFSSCAAAPGAAPASSGGSRCAVGSALAAALLGAAAAALVA